MPCRTRPEQFYDLLYHIFCYLSPPKFVHVYEFVRSVDSEPRRRALRGCLELLQTMQPDATKADQNAPLFVRTATPARASQAPCHQRKRAPEGALFLWWSIGDGFAYSFPTQGVGARCFVVGEPHGASCVKSRPHSCAWHLAAPAHAGAVLIPARSVNEKRTPFGVLFRWWSIGDSNP